MKLADFLAENNLKLSVEYFDSSYTDSKWIARLDSILNYHYIKVFSESQERNILLGKTPAEAIEMYFNIIKGSDRCVELWVEDFVTGMDFTNGFVEYIKVPTELTDYTV